MKSEKSEKYVRVGSAILKIMAQGGVRAVNHSAVSRMSGVSRGWIYKYVGSSSETLISFASDHFGQALLDLGGVERPRDREKLRQHTYQNTRKIIDFLSKHPEVFEIYYRYAGTKSPMGEKIHAFEKKHIQEFSKAVVLSTGKSKVEAEIIGELMILMWMGLSFREHRLGMGKRYSKEEIFLGMSGFFKSASKLFTS